MQARLEAEKKRAEEAKAAALDAERKAAKDAAEKAAAALVSSKEVKGQPKGSGSDQQKKVQSTGISIANMKETLSLSLSPPLSLSLPRHHAVIFFKMM